jgi:putative hemolysin
MLSALARQIVSPLPWLPDLVRPWNWIGPAEFQRKITVDFTARNYRVKTVESTEELRQVLRLRRSVFHYEFAKKWISLKSDKDEFDDDADHLAIFDQETGKVAGVYRLIPSHVGRRFYSSSEFDVSTFLATPGNKLELSRACISKEYRNGVVISLLWRGIAEYARAAGTDYLFGLTSINTTDLTRIADTCRYFESEGLLDMSYNMTPKAKYMIPNFEDIMSGRAGIGDGTVEAAGRDVPPLIKSYIRAGAKVCSQPVIDRVFNCADWLTVLDMRKLAASYERKYRQDSVS